MLYRFSVPLIITGYLLLHCSVFAEDLKTVYVDTPSLCYQLDRVDGRKVYIVSTKDTCVQIMGKISVKVDRAIDSVDIYTNGAFWKEMKTENPLAKYLPKKEDLEKAKQYENLKDKADMDKVQSVVRPSTQQQTDKQTEKVNLMSKPDKQKYIFYLFSKSIPDIALESVFNQSKKLNINFYGVLRGIDKDRVVLEKVKGIKGFKDITIKINPLIFKAVGAEVVPAIVYAHCPPPAMFRSADCDFKYVVYGDLSLLGALEVMGRHDSEAEKLYEELKNVF